MSRRAIKAARTTLAINLDPENGKRWLAYEERVSRWSSRRAGEKPPSLDYKALAGDALAEELNGLMGTYSDAEVHFTPEVLSGLDFQHRARRNGIYSEYLETNDSKLAHHLVSLAAANLCILKTMDRCVNGSLWQTRSFVHL